jgi:Malectin domain/Bacterial TSP3 repeat
MPLPSHNPRLQYTRGVVCQIRIIGNIQRKNQGKSTGGGQKTPLTPHRSAIPGHPSETGAPWREVACVSLPTFLVLGAFLPIVLTALVLFWFPSRASAAPVTLAWDAVTDSRLAGYKIYYGYASRSYSLSVNVGKVTTAALSGLDQAKVYYLAVVASDASGNESDYSNEVIYNLEQVDTDGDGLNDWEEIDFYKTDPNKADTDGDGLSDGDEVATYNTDPTRSDTDGDGVPDGVEVRQGSNPRDPASIPVANQVVLAVNAGGQAYTATDGTAYQADKGFRGGTTRTKTVAIAGTPDAKLYQSERAGAFSYAIPVANGNYVVTLQFAELTYAAVGRRLFDVLIEGKLVLDNLDLYATVGRYAAYDVTLPVTINDGVLDITFRIYVAEATVSAIVVEAQ